MITKKKVAFIIEYFPPITFGGAEWSTYYLAKEYSNSNDIHVFVITPDYGVKNPEQTIKIFKFYSGKQIHKNDSVLSSLFFINPIWICWAAFNIYKFSRINKIDILHIHGKMMILPTKLANLFLRKKILATIRDYQVICNYGFCIYEKNLSCNIKEYFLKDFVKYLNEYVKDINVKTVFINLLFAIYGRLVRNLIKFFSQSIKVVVLSKKQKEIFLANGYKNVSVVGNSIEFSEVEHEDYKILDYVLFVGRLTPGKGVDILIELLNDFLQAYPKYKFYFVGDGMLKNKLLSLEKHEKRIKVLGKVDHSKLDKIYAQALVTIVPSVWPEPFGRIPLESLNEGTPVVVSNKGGLPEIVRDGRWGYIVEPNENTLLTAIKKAIEKNADLRKNIKNDRSTLQELFGKQVKEGYLKIYKKL